MSTEDPRAMAQLLVTDGTGASYAVPLSVLEAYRLPDSVHDEVAALFRQLSDDSNDEVSSYGASEISMIELQGVVAQRGMAIQMTTGLMQILNQNTRTIPSNIGR